MEEDLKKIDDLCKQIAGRSFCALGDAAATPFPGAMRFFEDEIKEAEKIIHQVVRPHITGLGKIKSPIKNAKALTKATNEWEEFKNKHSENLNPIIVKWVDTCMKKK